MVQAIFPVVPEVFSKISLAPSRHPFSEKTLHGDYRDLEFYNNDYNGYLSIAKYGIYILIVQYLWFYLNFVLILNDLFEIL